MHLKYILIEKNNKIYIKWLLGYIFASNSFKIKLFVTY